MAPVRHHDIMRFEHEGKSYSVHITWPFGTPHATRSPIIELIIYHAPSGDKTLPVSGSMLQVASHRVRAWVQAMRALGCDDFSGG